MKLALYSLVFAVFLTIIKSTNLSAQPLYLDEGLYIFWAKLFEQSSGFAYVSMQDGKTPLFMWIVAYLHQYLGTSLFSARFASVVSGSVTTLSLAIVTYKIFGVRSAVFFCVLMAASPYMFLIDRMALVDSMMVGFASVSFLLLFVTREIIKNQKSISLSLILSLLSGLFLGLAYLTKSSTKIFLVANVLVGMYWVFEISKNSKKNAVILAVCLILTGLTYFEIQGYLKVGAYQFWNQMYIKESQLTYKVSEVVSSINTAHLIMMLKLSLEYLLIYAFTAFVLAWVGALSMIGQRKNYWLIGYPIAIFFAVAVFGKVNASRYIYSMIPSLTILSAVGASYLWERRKHFVIALILVSVVQVIVMLISPTYAPYSKDDKSYFFKSNLSALGLDGVVSYMKSKRSGVVGVTGVWGVLEGSQTVLDDANIRNINIDPWRANLSRLLSSQEKKYIYLTRGDADLEDLAKQVHFKTIQEFTRPDGGSKTYLLEVLDN